VSLESASGRVVGLESTGRRYFALDFCRKRSKGQGRCRERELHFGHAPPHLMHAQRIGYLLIAFLRHFGRENDRRYSILLAFITEDRCGCFCWPTWRRSEVNLLLFPSRRPGFWPHFCPQKCSISGAQPGTEGMFRVGKTKVQTAAKNLCRHSLVGAAAPTSLSRSRR
jgi:hypothetical protein